MISIYKVSVRVALIACVLLTFVVPAIVNAQATEGTQDLSWSPDGSQLATASMDGRVYIWAQTEQRCGREIPADIQGTFWSSGRNRGVTTVAPAVFNDNQVASTNAAIAAQTEMRITFPFDLTSLQNGTALAALQQPRSSSRSDDEKTLSIFTQDGQVITLSDAQKPNSMHWWRLIPEREPYHFSIFGYDDETTAFVVDMRWSPNGITVGQPQYLPFEFYPMQFYWAMLSTSPDGEFVAYIHPTQTNGLEFFIYSLTENRYIWRAPYDGNAFASIIWTPDSQVVGVVSGTTPETQDQLIAVDRNGESSLLVDLSTIYGEGVSVLPLSGIALSSNQVAFLLNSPQQDTQSFATRLALLDLESRQITDLCYSTTSELLPLGVIDGNIILEDTSARQIVAISAQTGDYSYIDLSEGVRPLPGTFEPSDATDTP
jgi:WD40 repeat protein